MPKPPTPSKSSTTKSSPNGKPSAPPDLPSRVPLAQRRRFLMGLLKAALGPRPDLPHARAYLRNAVRAGLNWREMYAEAVERRPQRWGPPPPIEDVDPGLEDVRPSQPPSQVPSEPARGPSEKKQ